MAREISRDGLALIKLFEGLRLQAYADIVGVATIGWGHTKTVTKEDVRNRRSINLAQAEALLKSDLKVYENAVDKAVKVPLNDNQFAALVSLCFNIGTSAFAKSTLVKLLNQSNYREAAPQFNRWNKAGGKVVAGLSRRRQHERALFEKAVSK